MKREGIARELVNRVQNIRKSSGFEITDKINIEIENKNEIVDAVNDFKDYIASQVLAVSINVVDTVVDGTELDFDDFKVNVAVVKA